MKSAKLILLKAIDALVILAIGVCYVTLLREVISFLYPLFPEPGGAIDKMLFTASSSLISCIMIFSLNALITRQNSLWIGVSCMFIAFVYFYIIKLWPDPYLVVLVFMTGYSAFAFFAFVVIPVVIGVFLNHIKALGGLSELFLGK